MEICYNINRMVVTFMSIFRHKYVNKISKNKVSKKKVKVKTINYNGHTEFPQSPSVTFAKDNRSSLDEAHRAPPQMFLSHEDSFV